MAVTEDVSDPSHNPHHTISNLLTGTTPLHAAHAHGNNNTADDEEDFILEGVSQCSSSVSRRDSDLLFPTPVGSNSTSAAFANNSTSTPPNTPTLMGGLSTFVVPSSHAALVSTPVASRKHSEIYVGVPAGVALQQHQQMRGGKANKAPVSLHCVYSFVRLTHDVSDRSLLRIYLLCYPHRKQWKQKSKMKNNESRDTHTHNVNQDKKIMSSASSPTAAAANISSNVDSGNLFLDRLHHTNDISFFSHFHIESFSLSLLILSCVLF